MWCWTAKPGPSLRYSLCLKRPVPLELFGGHHQRAADAGLHGRVACILHHLQPRTRPGLVQGPGRLRRADHVLATLHDHSGQVRNAAQVGHQLVGREKAEVAKVMCLQPSHAQSHGVRAKFIGYLGVRLADDAEMIGFLQRWCGYTPAV